MLLIPYMIVLWVLIHKKYIQDSYGPVDPPKLVYSTVQNWELVVLQLQCVTGIW